MELSLTPELTLILGFMCSISGMLFLSFNFNAGWFFLGVGFISFLPLLPSNLIILPFIALTLAIIIGIIKTFIK
jgi:hypothetical protein